MSDPNFERQVRMIAAGDKGDFGAVNELLREDKYLHAFGNYLYSMLRHDRGVIEKSLALPNLDKTLPAFERVVQHIVTSAAIQGRADVIDLMLSQSKHPSEDAGHALKFLFNRLAEHPGTPQPSTEVGKLLIARGAKLKEALAVPHSRLSSRAAELETLTGQVENFRDRLAPPPPADDSAKPEPAAPEAEQAQPGAVRRLLQKFRR